MAKKKKRAEVYSEGRRTTWASAVMESPVATLVFALLAIALGLVFILTQDSEPVGREEAEAYTGVFESYRTSKNYCGIHFSDGTVFEVYPHTETQEFHDCMKSLPAGTRLYLLINPNSGFVAEIRTDAEELLNFEESQRAIDEYDDFYVWLGVFVCACGVFLIWYALLSARNKKKERMRRKKKQERVDGEGKPLRRAGKSGKERIFHKVSAKGYEICYRRVGRVNELIVNGLVYDELCATVEFPHVLTAEVDGHIFSAGLDKNDVSFVALDGRRLAERTRWI